MDGIDFHAVVLGIVQGLTEFLPISSSAHLILVPQFLGWNDPFINSLAFGVMLHMGTLVALLIYFRTDLWRLPRARGWPSIRERSIGDDPDRRLAWLLVDPVDPGGDPRRRCFESSSTTAFREQIAWSPCSCSSAPALLWLADRWGRAPAASRR